MITMESYIEWLSCHKKGMYYGKGLVDVDPYVSFLKSLERILPTACVRLGSESAEKVTEEILKDFPMGAFTSFREGEWLMDRLRHLIIRCLCFFVRTYSAPRLEEKEYEFPLVIKGKALTITGMNALSALNDKGRREYIMFDAFTTNSRFSCSRRPENRPEAEPRCQFMAAVTGDDAACYSVWFIHGTEDSGSQIPPFELRSGSNICRASFNSVAEAADGFRRTADLPEKKNCFVCNYSGICRGYKPLPKFSSDDGPGVSKVLSPTKEQEYVINHADGPLLVIASPGSGKTLVLTERAKKLMQNGVRPENILLLAYTRQAAAEMERRLTGTGDPLSQVNVQTINSLGYGILNSCANLLKRKSLIADDATRKRFIKGLLDTVPRHICEPLSGRNGYVNRLNTMFKLLEEQKEDVGRLKARFKGVRTDEVMALYHDFKLLLSECGYITYDMQITEAVKLLKNNPSLAVKLGSLYRYVMVDEFQDIDADQLELLRLITPHGNIVAVGDDDQAVYTFRGGNNEALLNFDGFFEKAKTVCLGANFRSDLNIVEASAHLICNNTKRLKKQLTAVKGKTNGSVTIVSDISREQLIRAYINPLLADFKGRNIAVIARTNNELGAFYDALINAGIPAASTKDFLVDDRVFCVVRDVLSLYFDLEGSRSAFSRLWMLFGDGIGTTGCTNESLYHSLVELQRIPCLVNSFTNAETIKAADSDSSGYKFAKKLFMSYFLLDYAEHVNLRLLEQLTDVWFSSHEGNLAVGISELERRMRESGVSTVRAMFDYMNVLVEYDDTTRLVYDYGSNAVRLYTAHDSKGMEFDAVIVPDVESFYKAGTEEDRRTLYVAMSRARHVLVMGIQSELRRDNIMNEICGVRSKIS